MLSRLQSVAKADSHLLIQPTNPSIKGDFQQKISLELSSGRFVARTARNEQDLEKILELRKYVFHREFARRRFSWRSERDQFDDYADHLGIYDTERQLLIGTYRLINSTHANDFYSATEFWIEGVTCLQGVKLELSRACVHPDYRNGAILSLLWKAIAQYARLVGAEYLFGLSSVPSTNLHEIVGIYRYLQKQGFVDFGYNVIPRDKYAIRDLPKVMATQLKLSGLNVECIDDQVPPLLKSYLRAGAKVCSYPVIDNAFKCADFLTVLPLRQLSPAFSRRFMDS